MMLDGKHIPLFKVLKSLYDARWEAYAVALEAILMSYPLIIEALEHLQEDYSQKSDTRREAETIANKMQESRRCKRIFFHAYDLGRKFATF